MLRIEHLAITLIFVVGLLNVSFTGAAESGAVATEAPPGPRIEIPPTAPGPGHTWIPGHWHWTGEDFAWSAGHWTPKPSVNATWIGGHWTRRGRVWVWSPGHWKGR